MSKEECGGADWLINYAPDFIVTIFWIFLATIMLGIVILIVTLGLNALIAWYQDKREAYLRNKKLQTELELLEKQKNGNQS